MQTCAQNKVAHDRGDLTFKLVLHIPCLRGLVSPNSGNDDQQFFELV